MFLLDDLARVFTEVELPNGRALRVRALSDTELRQRDMEALAVSARLAQRLKDSNTAEYAGVILPLLEAPVEGMRQTLLSFRYLSATREAARSITPQYIPFPEGAEEEERREVVLRREGQMKELAEKRGAEVKRLVDETQVELSALGEEDLTRRIRESAASASADGVFADESVHWTIYMACEKPGGGRFFGSIEEVRSLGNAVRAMLYLKYNEVDRVDPFHLPSPSVTGSSPA